MRWIALVLLVACTPKSTETPVRWTGESHTERRAHPTWALRTIAPNGDVLVMDAWTCTRLHRNETIRACDVSERGFESVASRARPGDPGPLEIDFRHGPPGSEEPGALWQAAGDDPDALRAFEDLCACYR
jgi:hypothetical protein